MVHLSLTRTLSNTRGWCVSEIQYSKPWVLSTVFSFSHQLLCWFNCIFCFPLWLWVGWTLCPMVEFPHILKVTELLRGKLGSIVTDDFVWNSMPSEVLFQLVDYSCWWSGLQSVYFKEIANLVYSDEVLDIADWKQEKVYSYDRPRTVGCLMRNESFCCDGS